jgi:hypothetical protein
MMDTERKSNSIQLRANEKVLRAIASLQGTDDFKVFSDWITEQFFSISISIATDLVLPDRAHEVAHGRSIALFELKEIIKNAREEIRRMKEAKENFKTQV